eukprot:CFRG7047T1
MKEEKSKKGKQEKSRSRQNSKSSLSEQQTATLALKKNTLSAKLSANNVNKNSPKALFNWMRRKGSSQNEDSVDDNTNGASCASSSSDTGNASSSRRWSLSESTKGDSKRPLPSSLEVLESCDTLRELAAGITECTRGYITPDLNDLKNWHTLSLNARGCNKAKRIKFVTDVDRLPFHQLYSGLPVPFMRPSANDDEDMDEAANGFDVEPNDSETDKWNFIANRGFIRIYHRNENRHTTVTADLNISCLGLCQIVARKFNVDKQDAQHVGEGEVCTTNLADNGHHLYIQSGSKLHPFSRRLNPDEQPLKIQKQWLQDLGYTEDDNLQLQGRTSIQHLVRFIYTDSEEEMVFRGLREILTLELMASKTSSMSWIAALQVLDLNLKRKTSMIPVGGTSTDVQREDDESDEDENIEMQNEGAVFDLTGMDVWMHDRQAYIEHELKNCDFNQHVVELSFRSNILSTTPAITCTFTKLTTLDLSNNRLTDISSQLASACPKLAKLGLSDNRFTIIPVVIQFMSVLQVLDVSNNKLIGLGSYTLPTSLVVLQLHKNQITSFDRCVERLTNLNTLDLSHNLIRKLPDLKLPHLVYLNLNGNSLSRADLTGLRLRTMLCKANFLTLIQMDLTLMTELNLSRNKIATLPDMFDRATSLKILNLTDNQLNELPKSITSLFRLEVLKVRRNQLWSLPSMGEFRHLHELDVAQNNLTYLPDNLFQLPLLKILNASSNQIQSLPNLLWKLQSRMSTPSLTLIDPDNQTDPVLDINSANDLTESDVFFKDEVTQVTTPNYINDINSQWDLKPLKRVGSDHTDLAQVKEYDAVLSTPRRMSAECDQLGLRAEVKRIPVQDSATDFNTALISSHLPRDKSGSSSADTTPNSLTSNTRVGPSLVSSNPQIGPTASLCKEEREKGEKSRSWSMRRKSKGTKPVSFHPQCTIEILYLGKNKLQTDCLKECISQMTALRELHISNNNISELRYLNGLTNMEILNMNSNGVMNVHGDVEYLRNLRALSLSDNRLSTLPLSMTKLVRLEMLELSDNNIRHDGVHKWTWTSNPGLRVLNLARNKYLGISNLSDITSLTNLEVLDLDGVILPCRHKVTHQPGYPQSTGRLYSATQACIVCFNNSIPPNLLETIRLGPNDYPRPNLYKKPTRNGSFSSAQQQGLLDVTMSGGQTAFSPASELQAEKNKLPLQSGITQSYTDNKLIGQFAYTLNGCDFSEVNSDPIPFDISTSHRVFGIFDAYGATDDGSVTSNASKVCSTVAKVACESFMTTFWDAIVRAYDGIDVDNNISRSLRRAVLGINRVIDERLPDDSQWNGCNMGVLCISRTRVWAANCGTTLSVLCRNGQAVPLSTKHTGKNREERMRVLQRGGNISKEGHLFGLVEGSRGLGMFALQPFLNAGPHVVDHHISHDDEFIIMACHGLWSCMSFQYAVEIVRHEYSSERAAQTLRDRASMLGVSRSITVIVIFTPKIRRALRKEGLTSSLRPRRSLDRPMVEVSAPHGKVTLVFTDIQDSTELWEEEEDAMREAVRIHNELIRKLLLEHGGYEVKTEGDAFMIAFDTSLAALRWALHAQTSLIGVRWSDAILSRRSCMEIMMKGDDDSEQLVFKGLRVRMGIHTGCPDCEADPITGRMDYFGPMVNRSARVSALGQGGQIVISKHVWEEVQGDVGNDTEVSVLGSYNLKGMKQQETIRQILPISLHCRSEYFKKICAPPPVLMTQESKLISSVKT